MDRKAGVWRAIGRHVAEDPPAKNDGKAFTRRATNSTKDKSPVENAYINKLAGSAVTVGGQSNVVVGGDAGAESVAWRGG